METQKSIVCRQHGIVAVGLEVGWQGEVEVLEIMYANHIVVAAVDIEGVAGEVIAGAAQAAQNIAGDVPAVQVDDIAGCISMDAAASLQAVGEFPIVEIDHVA